MSIRSDTGAGIVTATSAIVLAVFLTSCLDIYAPAGAPTGVSATTGEEDRIVISWESTERTAFYSIYRSDTEDGDYAFIGSTSQTSYIDTDVDPEVEYWYRVASVPFSAESPYSVAEVLSAPVKGDSIHIFSWSISPLVTGAVSVRVSADRVEEHT